MRGLATAYTQDANQHVLPGMERDAATRFHACLAKGTDEGDAVEPGNDDREPPEKDHAGMHEHAREPAPDHRSRRLM